MLGTDAASDAITHFIGLFHLTDLQARLRLDYDALLATPLLVETGPVTARDMSVPHPYVPRDFGPDLRYVPPPVGLETVENAATLDVVPIQVAPFIPLPTHATLPLAGVPQVQSAQTSTHPTPVTYEWQLPVPGSVAVVIVQHATLDDNDMFNADDFAGAVAQGTLMAELDGLVQLALAAGVSPDLTLPTSEADFLTMAQHLGQAEAPAAAEGAEVFTATGGAASGSFLNGVAGASLPDLEGLLPQSWRDAQGRGEGEDQDGPAHDIVHGANMLLNEVTLTASWISAPVLAVAGASYSFDLISQVNIWQDIDTVTGLTDSIWNGSGTGTSAFNFASITQSAHPMSVAAQGDAGAPAFWMVTTIEGSLINFNWIEQRNFVSDNDVTSITLQGMETTLVFGENQSANQISLLELGSQFDLIIVDGNLISIAAILQTNVLLDSDHVNMRDGGGLSSGDNLLLNDATIQHVGTAQYLPAAGGFAALLAGGSGDVPDEVLNDPAFAGLHGLRVLHIKGDLVSAQIIEQINILGDADQVDLLAARAMQNAGDVAVVTGSNVLINAAHVTQFGVDSTIHTGGGVYSDALIHQAGLADTGSPFAGTGLASEAVVYLADGMAGSGSVDSDNPAIAPMMGGDAMSVDPMHTVLA